MKRLYFQLIADERFPKSWGKNGKDYLIKKDKELISMAVTQEKDDESNRMIQCSRNKKSKSRLRILFERKLDSVSSFELERIAIPFEPRSRRFYLHAYRIVLTKSPWRIESPCAQVPIYESKLQTNDKASSLI